MVGAIAAQPTPNINSFARAHACSVVAGGAIRGVDLVWLDTQQFRDLLCDDVAHEQSQLPLCSCAGLDGSAIDDDPGRQRPDGGEGSGERHPVVVPVVDRRDVLDRELDRREPRTPALVQPVDDLYDQLVEALGPTAGQRRARRREWAADATAMPSSAVISRATRNIGSVYATFSTGLQPGTTALSCTSGAPRRPVRRLTLTFAP